jgi:hypothetical protein
MVKDITGICANMPRGSAILYPNKCGGGDDPPSYHGFLKLPDGTTHWVLAWPRTVRNKPVIELKFIPKREGSSAND